MLRLQCTLGLAVQYQWALKLQILHWSMLERGLEKVKDAFIQIIFKKTFSSAGDSCIFSAHTRCIPQHTHTWTSLDLRTSGGWYSLRDMSKHGRPPRSLPLSSHRHCLKYQHFSVLPQLVLRQQDTSGWSEADVFLHSTCKDCNS